MGKLLREVQTPRKMKKMEVSNIYEIDYARCKDREVE
jgi:hypothetical protein